VPPSLIEASLSLSRQRMRSEHIGMDHRVAKDTQRIGLVRNERWERYGLVRRLEFPRFS
jgi:hypothetical protein